METTPARSTVEKDQHQHLYDDDDDNNSSQEQEYFVLLDLPSRTLSLLASTTSGSREEGRKGSFYSLVLDPKTLQACQEEIMEYDNMADFASGFAEALQGKKTVSVHVHVTKLREGGGQTGSTASIIIALTFDTEEETMSMVLPCLQEGVSSSLLPALRPFFHFDAATGIGRQPGAVGGGKEGVLKAVGARGVGAAAAGQKQSNSEGGGRGGGGGGQRAMQSLIHPRLPVRQTLTGSKWEDEDEEGEGSRRRKKKGEAAEESK